MIRRARAFTLVELLVVIAIIGILVALLLPAVQAARERARMTSCDNNLTQVILGLHGHELAQGSFPRGVSEPTGPVLNAPTGNHHNWISSMLPYVEQSALHRHIDFSVGVYAPANVAVRKFELSLIRCPSDFTINRPYSSYAGCHHDVEAPIDETNQGVLFLNKALTRDDIPDGLGYTIFVGEKLSDAWDLGWLSGTRATLRNTGIPINGFSDRNALLGRTVSSFDLGPPALSADADSGVEDPFPLAPFDTSPPQDPPTPVEPPPMPPESAGPTATPYGQPYDQSRAPAVLPAVRKTKYGPPRSASDVLGFGSGHVTCGFAYGDGSIHRISDSILPAVYQQLGSRADGKLPPAGY